jgi:DNA-binding transcriptional LysR family regulator
MIESLRAMAIFVRVAEAGTFRGAANTLGLSPSVISHQVSMLEEQLGAPLFYRSTRKVTLTEQGKTLLHSATAMLSAAQTGLSHFVDDADAPVGKLNISLPAVLTSHVILDHLAQFSTKHPSIALSLRFSDTRENLIASGLDLAIRMGQTTDPSGSRRTLAMEPRYLVASRDYVGARDIPSHPDDIVDWDFIHFSPRLSPLVIKRNDGSSATLGDKTRISVDNSLAMHRFTLAGAGYAALPQYIVDGHIRSGALVRLLPEWQLKSLPLVAVWPDASTRNHLTARLIDFLSKEFCERISG